MFFGGSGVSRKISISLPTSHYAALARMALRNNMTPTQFIKEILMMLAEIEMSREYRHRARERLAELTGVEINIKG